MSYIEQTKGMTIHTFTMTEAQAELVHSVVSSHSSALKNWACSAIEQGDMDRAQGLVKELREYQTLFATFNMPAKRDIARFTDKPLKTTHSTLGRL